MWLMVGGQVQATRVRLKTPSGKWVTLLGSQAYSEPRRSAPNHERWMCLPYRRIEERFPEVVAGWIRLRVEECGDAFSQWPTVIEGAVGPIEGALTSCVQFLDSVLPSSERPVPKAEFAAATHAMLIEVPDSLPAEVIEAVKRGIREANRYTLRQRIDAARRNLPVALLNEYALDEKVVGQAVLARNNMLHQGELGIRIEDAVLVHARIRLLAIAYVLQQIGVPSDLLCERVKACHALHPPESVTIL